MNRKKPIQTDVKNNFFVIKAILACLDALPSSSYTVCMVGDQIFISRKGYQKMLAEVDELKGRKPKIAQAIKEAMEKGDLKENAEYHAAKEELMHVQRRIAELE